MDSFPWYTVRIRRCLLVHHPHDNYSFVPTSSHSVWLKRSLTERLMLKCGSRQSVFSYENEKTDLSIIPIIYWKIYCDCYNKLENKALFQIYETIKKVTFKFLSLEMGVPEKIKMSWIEVFYQCFFCTTTHRIRMKSNHIVRIAMFYYWLFQIVVFAYYAIVASQDNNPFNDVTATSGVPFQSPLIYLPSKRYQVWRFLSYMFIHNGYFHLIFNCILQFSLGTFLELVHKFWRVGIVYILGVLAGEVSC